MNRSRPKRNAVVAWVARVPRRTVVLVLSILAVLIAARIAAPFVIEWYLNRELARLPDYRGHIDDVDLSLIDGHFAVDELRLDRRKGNPKLPFLRVDRIEVDYRWDDLFRGRIVADVTVDRPVLNVMQAATAKRKPSDQLDREEEGEAITETIQTLLPTKIHHLHVRGGQVRFKDTTTSPDVDLNITRLDLFVSNISNQPPGSDTAMPTRGRATARLQKSGRLRAAIRLNIFPEHPTFDLDLALRGLDVRELNKFAKAYAKADMEKGTASFFIELKAQRGRIKGYFKPMLDDVEVLDTDGGDEDDPWYRQAWEGAVGAVEELFQDQDKDRAATRIPIAGRVDQPGVDVWTSVVGLVVNAFIEALFPGLDHTIGGSKGKDDD